MTPVSTASASNMVRSMLMTGTIASTFPTSNVSGIETSLATIRSSALTNMAPQHFDDKPTDTWIDSSTYGRPLATKGNVFPPIDSQMIVPTVSGNTLPESVQIQSLERTESIYSEYNGVSTVAKVGFAGTIGANSPQREGIVQAEPEHQYFYCQAEMSTPHGPFDQVNSVEGAYADNIGDISAPCQKLSMEGLRSLDSQHGRRNSCPSGFIKSFRTNLHITTDIPDFSGSQTTTPEEITIFVIFSINCKSTNKNRV
ncbi:hypothetical protein BGZ65_009424 [Modicella reniformis]|uniref:Uncharacterized protein n=1 Tax=Modicella reniformis TaxID=1440133 RepID=A0A9P6MB21_9FUNG|nr:hypothetical protein BGZ65_009424 [Modicella reniformis]